jgi:hypothetical protein
VPDIVLFLVLLFSPIVVTIEQSPTGGRVSITCSSLLAYGSGDQGRAHRWIDDGTCKRLLCRACDLGFAFGVLLL